MAMYYAINHQRHVKIFYPSGEANAATAVAYYQSANQSLQLKARKRLAINNVAAAMAIFSNNLRKLLLCCQKWLNLCGFSLSKIALTV